ncbi:MAG: bifunctional adenosylcobinamide kinase/adenosylcobinamide-phosphate guanylyltransferase [Candidatus Nanopelagicales bacterium]|nr:bifunctional adenosylcobinamide kinase/adenosylcobinamide-phosphate guanylyltransferase [Candidatus Nanopelagicales bacterium]
MRVQLLGTGSADGLPNPFCECATCSDARLRGQVRGSSAALVDGQVLIDFGPTVASTASRLGVSLHDVRHVLITHGHPDHLLPDFLLWRSWIEGLGTLHVWGPAHALARLEHWVAATAPVEFHTLSAGDERTLPLESGAATVRALPAAHAHGNGDIYAEEALLYDVTAADGHRLLYASDTGPVSEACLALVRDRAFDVLLIEETFGHHASHGTGHLDLTTLPTVLADLVRAGAVSGSTDVIAIHLSHHNPPADELRTQLAAMGVRCADDGTVIDTRTSRAPRTFIVGGARSGKSAFAEALAARAPVVVYVATGGEQPGDTEWAARVHAHRERRPAHWTTIETADLVAVISGHAEGLLLIDCISLWLTRVLDDHDAWATHGQARDRIVDVVQASIDALVAAVRSSRAELIIVSNEVGQGVVPPTSAGRLFRDLLGIANARLADACDHAWFMVAGRTLPLASTHQLLTRDAP